MSRRRGARKPFQTRVGGPHELRCNAIGEPQLPDLGLLYLEIDCALLVMIVDSRVGTSSMGFECMEAASTAVEVYIAAPPITDNSNGRPKGLLH